MGKYNDPAAQGLTDVVDYAIWGYNGSCVTSAAAGANLGWSSYTGWYIVSNNHTQGADCSDVWSNSVTTFENDVFPLCEGWPIQTKYEPEWVHGHPNGTATWQAVLWDGPFAVCADYIWPVVVHGYGTPPSA